MTTRLALLFLLAAVPLRAQQSMLSRADSLLVAGQYEQARAALAEWDKANPGSVSTDPAQRAHALYLTARLTTDAAQAQNHYLTVALSYPTSRDAPDALLRIGQSYFTAGDATRAVSYLERLIDDYPSASARPLGFLWLTRAQIAAGNARLACTTATAALKAGTSIAHEIATLLADEQRSACAAPSPPTDRAPPVPERRTDSTNDGRYAIQVAAFRELRSANAIAAQLRRKGYDTRVIYVEGSGLARVRIGRFRTNADALNEIRRLKAENIDGIVVDDATRERIAR